MAPVVGWRVGSEPRKNKELANGTLAACQAAAAHEDFAIFTTMEIWNAEHTSNASKHVSVKVKTAVQTTNNQHQVAHIYVDKEFTDVAQPDGKTKTVTTYTYRSHILFPNVKNDNA